MLFLAVLPVLRLPPRRTKREAPPEWLRKPPSSATACGRCLPIECILVNSMSPRTWVQYQANVRYAESTTSERAESIINEALTLSPLERAELIERLYESLRSEGEREIERTWAQESERRVDRVLSGKEPTVSYEQMKDELSTGNH